MSESLKKIRPLQNRVVVRLIERAEKTAGGLFIPQSVKDQDLAWQATVLSVGPGKTLDDGRQVAPDVKKGDTVLVGKYLGTEVVIEGEKIVIVEEDHLLGVVEG